MKKNSNKTLVLITGPTAVGKTDACIHIARSFHCPIISADSRQFYKELKIGAAAPSQQELAAVPHFFIGHLSVTDYYNVSLFEQQALGKLNELFVSHEIVILTGGSGLYIDALLYGIDDLPDIDPLIRDQVKNGYLQNGIEFIRRELRSIDPEYYAYVDLANPNRMMRAIEVFYQTGNKFSSLHKNEKKQRNFNTLKILLSRQRDELNERINARTDLMFGQGLLDEAKSLLPFRNENALNTVGYKEVFNYLDGEYSLEMAIEKIKTNTRRYAKRQVTWFKRYDDWHVYHPGQIDEIIQLINSKVFNIG